MEFTFEYAIPEVPVISGDLLLCDDATCTISNPLPFVWFVFPLLQFHSVIALIIGELFALIFEAIILWLAGRNQGLAFWQAGGLSLVANGVSCCLGLGIGLGVQFLL